MTPSTQDASAHLLQVDADATDRLDAALFRDGMRRLTGAVCVITTRDLDGTPSGLTATAVCSLSAEPPTLLCCLNRNSRTYGAILRSKVLGVNVLTDTLRPVADAFAGSGPTEQKFLTGGWTQIATGAPILEGSATSFDCRLVQTFGYGTHTVLIGSVVGVSTTDAAPLLYRAGGYGAFAPLG